MGKNTIIYPMLDEKRETRIPVCTERLMYGGNEYFFSPYFKTSDEVIKGILRGYSKSKKGFLDNEKLKVYLDFEKDRKLKTEVKEQLQKLKGKIEISYGEVIAYFKNDDYPIFFTRERIISECQSDTNQNYLNCPIENINIAQCDTLYEDTGDITGAIYVFDYEFSDRFRDLLGELKDLNKTLEQISYEHPLNGETREIRESYLGILVDKSLADGNLSSNEVIRLEILARQMGINSATVLEQMDTAMKNYDDKKGEEYISISLEKKKKIPDKYMHMLYHDIITFELLSNKGKIANPTSTSDFSKTFARRCSIQEDFARRYTEAMQKLVASSYELRNIMSEFINVEEKKEAYECLFDSVKYEYNLQKELLK